MASHTRPQAPPKRAGRHKQSSQFLQDQPVQPSTPHRHWTDWIQGEWLSWALVVGFFVVMFGGVAGAAYAFNWLATPHVGPYGIGMDTHSGGATSQPATQATPTSAATPVTTPTVLPTATAAPASAFGWAVELIFTASNGQFHGKAGAHGGGVSCGPWQMDLARGESITKSCPAPSQIAPNTLTTVDYDATDPLLLQSLTVTNPDYAKAKS